MPDSLRDTPAPRAAPVRLAHYRVPEFLVDRVALVFDLDPAETIVRSTLEVRRNPASAERTAPLRLDGEAMELRALRLDGSALGANRYLVEDGQLVIAAVPEAFTLEVETRVAPRDNTELSGLYLSNGGFFTQCEAEGFRR